jgi:hypothetical protein
MSFLMEMLKWEFGKMEKGYRGWMKTEMKYNEKIKCIYYFKI